MVPPISLGDVTRPSLGRTVCMGELYNIRNESLSCVSLFDTNALEHLIKSKDIKEEYYKYKFIENVADRFELLDIDTDTQASLICGLSQPRNGWEFLKDEKISQETVSCSLMFQFRTVHEKLSATLDEPSIDYTALAKTGCTHVVSDIIWGGLYLLSVELTCGPECNKKDARDRLAGEIETVLDCCYWGREPSRTELPILNSMRIFDGFKIHSNIQPRYATPVTFMDMMEILKNVPDLLAEGDKGKPLFFGLTPLNEFQAFANLNPSIPPSWKNVESVFVESIIYLFKHIEVTKQKLHDLKVVLYKQTEGNKARRFERELRVKAIKLRDIIYSGLLQLKSGEEKLLDLFMQVEEYKNRDLDLLTYNEYIDTCLAVIMKEKKPLEMKPP